MEGFGGAKEPGALIPFAWSPGWNSPQAWNKFQDEVGGHLASGDPGVRLIAPASQSAYYSPALSSAGQEQGHLKVVPLYHIFGSEELSAKAPAMENRIPAAYVALSRSDADYLQVSSGSLIQIGINNSTCALRVTVSDSLAAGTLGLPVGLNGIPFFNSNSWASVHALTQRGSTL